jgi:hypothetical protein
MWIQVDAGDVSHIAKVQHRLYLSRRLRAEDRGAVQLCHAGRRFVRLHQPRVNRVIRRARLAVWLPVADASALEGIHLHFDNRDHLLEPVAAH